MTLNNETCYSSRGQPLVVYYSQGEAADAAAYVKTQYGTAQEPYHCDKCGCWHLSPKGRATPSRMCVSCGKDLYVTKDAAVKRAKIIERERGVKLDVYKCQFNSGYHLTSHAKPESRKGKAFKKRY